MRRLQNEFLPVVIGANVRVHDGVWAGLGTTTTTIADATTTMHVAYVPLMSLERVESQSLRGDGAPVVLLPEEVVAVTVTTLPLQCWRQADR